MSLQARDADNWGVVAAKHKRSLLWVCSVVNNFSILLNNFYDVFHCLFLFSYVILSNFVVAC